MKQNDNQRRRVYLEDHFGPTDLDCYVKRLTKFDHRVHEMKYDKSFYTDKEAENQILSDLMVQQDYQEGESLMMWFEYARNVSTIQMKSFIFRVHCPICETIYKIQSRISKETKSPGIRWQCCKMVLEIKLRQVQNKIKESEKSQFVKFAIIEFRNCYFEIEEAIVQVGCVCGIRRFIQITVQILLQRAISLKSRDYKQMNYELCELMDALPSGDPSKTIYLNMMTMGEGQKWIYLIGCPIAFFLELSWMLLFLINPKMRRSPGDIFFATLFFEMMMAMSWFVTAVQSLHSPINTESLLCQFAAGTNVIASMMNVYLASGEFCYVIAFYYYLIQRVQNSIDASSRRTWRLHVGILLLTLTLIVMIESFNASGKNYDSQCSIQIFVIPDYLIVVGYLVTILAYVSIGLYSILYLRKNMPRHYMDKANQFIRFSIIYFIFYMSMSLFTQMLLIIGNLNCVLRWSLHQEVIFGFTAFLNISIVIGMPVIRSQDPDTNKLIRRALHLNTSINRTMDISLVMDSGVEMEDSIRPKAVTDSFVNILSNNIRQQIMAKLIAGLLVDQHSKYNIVDVEIINQKSNNIFEEKKIYTFRGPQLIEAIEMPNPFIELFEDQYEMRFISYCPIIFHVIMNREQEKIDIPTSIELAANLERVRNASQNDGGKSGQFFFFSSDHKLLLKTITQQELKVLLSKLNQYFTYVINHETLIAKIYGIYTLEQEQKPIHVILMKNIARTQNIYRTYDLKGSSYDREVTSAKREIDLQKTVLKDIDFLNIEKYLYVSQEDGQSIIKKAEHDSNFFRTIGLIDYSLIVFKIKNEEKYDYHDGVYLCEDKRYRYHIGIIDYLQEYNVQKQVEKYSKRLIKLDSALDTSSQDPVIYSTRFYKFMCQIIQ